MVKPLEQIKIDFLILADYTEVLNGKLYMMGGGYDRKRIDDLNQVMDLNLAVGILVPWHRANEPTPITLQVEDSDGTVLTTVKGQFNVGRPAQAVTGQVFRIMVSLRGEIKLPRLGVYRIVANVETDEKAIMFVAHDKDGKIISLPQAS